MTSDGEERGRKATKRKCKNFCLGHFLCGQRALPTLLAPAGVGRLFVRWGLCVLKSLKRVKLFLAHAFGKERKIRYFQDFWQSCLTNKAQISLLEKFNFI